MNSGQEYANFADQLEQTPFSSSAPGDVATLTRTTIALTALFGKISAVLSTSNNFAMICTDSTLLRQEYIHIFAVL